MLVWSSAAWEAFHAGEYVVVGKLAFAAIGGRSINLPQFRHAD